MTKLEMFKNEILESGIKDMLISYSKLKKLEVVHISKSDLQMDISRTLKGRKFFVRIFKVSNEEIIFEEENLSNDSLYQKFNDFQKMTLKIKEENKENEVEEMENKGNVKVRGLLIKEWLKVNGYVKIGNSIINDVNYIAYKNDESNSMIGIAKVDHLEESGINEHYYAIATTYSGDIEKYYGLKEEWLIDKLTSHIVKEFCEDIEFEGFDTKEDIFGDDIEFLEDIVNEACEDNYICDAISQASDNGVPIHTHELCKKCWELNDYVSEASSQGLLEGEFDLFRALSVGAYEYYSQLGYENEQNIKVAYLVIHIKTSIEAYPNIYAKSEAFLQCQDKFNNVETFRDIIDLFQEHYEDIIKDME